MSSPVSPLVSRRPLSTSGLPLTAGVPGTSPSPARRNGEINTTTSDGAYRASLLTHFAEDLERRRKLEKIVEDARNEVVPSDSLKLDMVELYSRDNAREHRTDRYEIIRDPSVPTTALQATSSSAVLRRGQPFFMALRFRDRFFETRRDILRVCFLFGPNPQVTKGTKVVLPLKLQNREFTKAPQKWDMRVHQQEGMIVTLQVNIPPTALVGLWRCVIETTTTTPGSRTEEFRVKDDIYVLFNPFCRDDTVYLDNEDLRREYVFNETGKVFVGTYRRPRGRKWIYGQFTDITLPAALVLLENSGLNQIDRGNPVKVVRALSAAVNAKDDQGLLEGKWQEPYDKGVSPWQWTGTTKILEKYLNQGAKPVKYGQCWVFAAVLTTLCRALGIPSRPVTNYVSAQDISHNFSVDKYFDVFGEEIKGSLEAEAHDSVWNFHVWTETWMGRPDLPHGYGGWQAIDSTLQINSEEKLPCGPASVEAVRKGEIGFAHDTPFVFSEVNADICHFQEDETSDWGFRKIKVNSYHTGRQILTKRAGMDDDLTDNDVEDITSLYKNPEGKGQSGRGFYDETYTGDEGDRNRRSHPAWPGITPSYGEDKLLYPGSAADRLSAITAVRSVDRTQGSFDFVQGKVMEDVFFDLVEIDKIPYGQPFSITAHIHNRSAEMRNITIALSASSVYYNGQTARRLARSDRQILLQPNQRETVAVRLSFEEYRDKLVEHQMIKVYSIACVQETKQTWSDQDDFQLEKPKLDIQVRGSAQANQDCYVTFSFMNPLPIALSECEFTMEGPGLVRPQTIKYRDVKAGEMVSHTQKFVPRQGGEKKLVVTFSSRELNDVVGSKHITVRD